MAERNALAVLVAALLWLPGWALSAEPAADAALERRAKALAGELRCLVCQNQTIADSSAGLAVDLRRQIRDQLARGDSDEQVRVYMTQRYGDFVLYRPPLRSTTLVLWAGPPLLLVGAVCALVVLLRRRQRASDQAFESDADDDLDDTSSDGPADQNQAQR